MTCVKDYAALCACVKSRQPGTLPWIFYDHFFGDHDFPLTGLNFGNLTTFRSIFSHGCSTVAIQATFSTHVATGLYGRISRPFNARVVAGIVEWIKMAMPNRIRQLLLLIPLVLLIRRRRKMRNRCCWVRIWIASWRGNQSTRHMVNLSHGKIVWRVDRTVWRRCELTGNLSTRHTKNSCDELTVLFT